jgi:hypothetical protein
LLIHLADNCTSFASVLDRLDISTLLPTVAFTIIVGVLFTVVLEASHVVPLDSDILVMSSFLAAASSLS